jgi:hypothetical protein
MTVNLGAGKRLAAVLASPPLTSGRRTMAALERAASALNCSSLTVANLINEPTRDVNEMTAVGRQTLVWTHARPRIAEVIHSSDIVLLAFGVTAPSGEARSHWRDQIGWLGGLVDGPRRGVGLLGRTHHPSRWHRYLNGRALADSDFAPVLLVRPSRSL